jgi:nuclear pore complex protein Nup107
MGRVQVAQKLLVLLPLELASISEPEERATEYLHYRQFFIIWDTLERVVECQALETPQMNRNTRAAWLDDYRVGFPMALYLFASDRTTRRRSWTKRTTR